MFSKKLHSERPPRVAAAYAAREEPLRRAFDAARLPWPPRDVLFRHFKQELEFEAWVRSTPSEPFRLFRTYPVCAASGVLGPKRREGDRQVPEGFYRIDAFNPVSSYHLSLRVNYPNASDRVLSDRTRPGGDIYVHGKCVTIGCIPLTDPLIEEVYVMAAEARAAGSPLEIHIFPGRDLDRLARLEPRHAAFWRQLAPGLAAFAGGYPPRISVGRDGSYAVSETRGAK